MCKAKKETAKSCSRNTLLLQRTFWEKRRVLCRVHSALTLKYRNASRGGCSFWQPSTFQSLWGKSRYRKCEGKMWSSAVRASLNVFHSITNKKCNVIQSFFYFCKLFYMFWVNPPPIIRSTTLYLQHLVFVKLLLLPAAIVDELFHDSGR